MSTRQQKVIYLLNGNEWKNVHNLQRVESEARDNDWVSSILKLFENQK